jgi:hypothetical protein
MKRPRASPRIIDQPRMERMCPQCAVIKELGQHWYVLVTPAGIYHELCSSDCLMHFRLAAFRREQEPAPPPDDGSMP